MSTSKIQKPDKQRLIFGAFLVSLVMVGEIVLEHFHLPPWPAFMCMIFFFISHMDIKSVPHILAGAVFGIVCMILVKLFVAQLAPVIGFVPSKLLFIAILVFAIVALGEILPIILNNYAFTFFLCTSLSSKIPDTNLYELMGVTLIGGGFLIAGVVGIGKITELLMRNQGEVIT